MTTMQNIDFTNANAANVKLTPRGNDFEAVSEEFERLLPRWSVCVDMAGVAVYKDGEGTLRAWVDYENAVGYIDRNWK